MEGLGSSHTVLEGPVVLPSAIGSERAQAFRCERVELSLGGKVLEHSMRRAVAQLPVLIRVAMAILLGDGGRTAFHEEIVEEHDARAWRERRVEPGQKLALPLEWNVGEPESCERRVKRATCPDQRVGVSDLEQHVGRANPLLGNLKGLRRRV